MKCQMENKIIDFQLGADLLGANLEAAREMVDKLVEILPGDLERLKAAFAKSNWTELKNVAHYVRGGASYCGTPRLKLAALRLDDAIGKEVVPEVIQTAYDTLCSEIELLLTEHAKLEKGSHSR